MNNTAMWLAPAASCLALFGGPILAATGAVAPISGFYICLSSAGLGLLGALGLLAWRRGAAKVPAAVALGPPVLLLGLGLTLPDAPMIHDVTTDPANPPAITTEGRPELAEADLSWPTDTAAEMAEHYGDLQPLVVKRDTYQVLAGATAIAVDRGWTVHRVGEDGIEVSHTSGVFRFVDDVTVRVTPLAPDSTRVDFRSRSRVGRSDLGVNADRIRALQTAMQDRFATP